MKTIYYSTIFALLVIVSCKTNPPLAPLGNRVSGKVFLKVDFNFTPQSKTVSKVVLLEDFANVSCNPCVTSNKIIEKLTRETYGQSKLIAVKYPTNFPAPNDPFYLANKAQCDSRISYYNVFFAPTTIIDGILYPNSLDSNSVKQKVNERLAATPAFEINISDEFIEGSYYVNVQVNLLTGSGSLDNLILHTVIIESEIEYDSAPGSNGETKFYDVMRNMLLSAEGVYIYEVQQSGSNTLELEADLIEMWNTNNLNTVVFIQNKTTKEVLQAGSTL
jgi:hypothetical protein